MNTNVALSRDELVQMYRTMILIRHFEETAIDYSKQGFVIGNMHMYVGEEAVATGVCKALTREDYVASTHRCDGHLIAKGADIRKMMAELMGKATGNCGGRAGKMHQCAPEVGLLSANGIVGASETLATGHALYCSMFAPGRIAVAFFGDGGGNQGAFHEAMNLAAVWKLPVIFVCENNHYAISTSVQTSTAMGSFYQRAAGYGIPGVLVNGNDAVAVYEAASTAAERARRGEGPTLIECDTYRLRGHHEGDEQTYRSREEVNNVKENNDCIKNMKQLLESEFAWTEAEDLEIYQSVTSQVEDAVKFGIESPVMSVEDMQKNLFETEGGC